MKIIVDSDGFFWPSSIGDEYMCEQRRYISIDREPQPISALFEQYYLGFRSALFICEDTVKNDAEALDVLRTYREGCLHTALSYVQKHITSEHSLPVDFLWIARMEIIDVLKEEYPEVENIKLKLSMKPRISAKTINMDTIIFPALARSVYIHCNLVLINSYFQAIDNEGRLVGDIDRRQIARLVFPYLLFCHDDISVQNLPMISAHSQDALSMAMQFTNLQMIFIFAHEYAHVLLQHFDEIAITLGHTEDMENEADTIALKVVLAYVENSKEVYSKYDVFTAIRWLFKYLLIDDYMSTLVQGKQLEFSDSKTEERRGSFQLELMKDNELDGSTLLDIVGFSMICELQNILYEFGSDLIENMINIYRESRKTGKIEPWWDQINGKEYSPGKSEI